MTNAPPTSVSSSPTFRPSTPASSMGGDSVSDVSEWSSLACVRLRTSLAPLLLEVTADTTVEQLCYRATEACGISPLAASCFGLFEEQTEFSTTTAGTGVTSTADSVGEACRDSDSDLSASTDTIAAGSDRFTDVSTLSVGGSGCSGVSDDVSKRVAQRKLKLSTSSSVFGRSSSRKSSLASVRSLFGQRLTKLSLTGITSPGAGCFAPGAYRLLVSGPAPCFTLLLRHWPHSPERLLAQDPIAFDYWFHQERAGFLAGWWTEKCRCEDLMGLSVTDMYRVMIERDVSLEHVLDRYRDFLPRRSSSALRRLFMRQPLRQNLERLVARNITDVDFIKLQYVTKSLTMYPERYVERYDVCISEGTNQHQAVLSIDPFHETCPGVRCSRPDKNDEHVCTISDLCYISIGDNRRIELARRCGVPKYFSFESQTCMESCVSGLNGWYRLLNKWSFCLNRQLQSPNQLKFRHMRSHGPISRSLARMKLLVHCGFQHGYFLIRLHRRSYHCYIVDVCVAGRQEPVQLKILETSAGQFSWASSKFSHTVHDSMSTLLSSYRLKDRDASLFQHCVLPSEQEEIPLGLFRDDALSEEECETLFSRGNNGFLTSSASSQPICILPRSLKLMTGRHAELHGRFTVVQRAQWYKVPHATPQQVAVKRLKQHLTDEHLQRYMDCVSDTLSWSCDSLLRIFGVCLLQSMSLVIEWLPLGPLHTFLANNKLDITQVDLVEAGACLAKALWYLDDHALTHGNIRCRNVLVAEHTSARLCVKLADPGLRLLDDSQIHWIPVECYDQPETALSSMMADVWAYGTTLWEIFSYGKVPLEGEDYNAVKQIYRYGGRLPAPLACDANIYQLMRKCWSHYVHSRSSPQAIMRDINQILYDVFHARQVHSYTSVDVSLPEPAHVSNNVSQAESAQLSVSAITEADQLSVSALTEADQSNASAMTDVDQLSVSTSASIENAYVSFCKSADLLNRSESTTVSTSDLQLHRSPITATNVCCEEYSLSAKDSIGAAAPDASHPPPIFSPPARHRVDHIVSIGKYQMVVPSTPHQLSADLSALRLNGCEVSDLDLDVNDSCRSSLAFNIQQLSSAQKGVCVLQLEESQLQLGDTLGTGFYGEVYKAVLTHTDGSCETVAVKRLKQTNMAGSAVEDMRREFDILKELRHENVVSLRGVIDYPELMIVLEYVPHGSLLTHLKTQAERLSCKQLLRYAVDIAQGMEYLGTKNIIHRDLAARNILVSADCRMKISDFGLAQVASTNAYYFLKTNRELPFRWYAPESIRHGKFSVKSDVWSYGITLYELFSLGANPQIPNCDDRQLLQFLDRGVRLCCPPRCPVGIYIKLLWPCWDESPQTRPSFAELLEEIEQQLLVEY